MQHIKASSKIEWVLRALFLGHYRPTESKTDAAKLTAWYVVMAIAWAGIRYTKFYWADHKTVEHHTPWNPEVPEQRKPDGTVAGVALDDLKYKVWKDPDHGLMVDPVGPSYLDPSDYWEGDPIQGWGPGKPNPYMPGTPAHEQWAHEQDQTSF